MNATEKSGQMDARHHARKRELTLNLPYDEMHARSVPQEKIKHVETIHTTEHGSKQTCSQHCHSMKRKAHEAGSSDYS